MRLPALNKSTTPTPPPDAMPTTREEAAARLAELQAAVDATDRVYQAAVAAEHAATFGNVGPTGERLRVETVTQTDRRAAVVEQTRERVREARRAGSRARQALMRCQRETAGLLRDPLDPMTRAELDYERLQLKRLTRQLRALGIEPPKPVGG
jgi:hypothetical protein